MNDTNVNFTSNRKLATIQRVAELRPIPGADRIEVCRLENLEWECVVKKGDFKIGDTVVYIEIDSRVPEREEFEFLRERKFRVKTIKLRKQVSEGLVMPISIIPNNTFLVGTDVTEILGITNYVKEVENAEEGNNANVKTKMPKWLMDKRWFRWVYFKLNPNDKSRFPSWITKTDEDRIQICARLLMEHYNEEWEITEKLDGTSGTFFSYMKKKWGIPRKTFSVASRNIWLKTKNGSKYWQVAEKLGMQKLFFSHDGVNIVLQGEILGPGIQKNKYNLAEIDLYAFNLIINGEKKSFNQMQWFCDGIYITTVPLICGSFIPSKEIGEGKPTHVAAQWMIEYSKGKSKLSNRNREGIVCRLKSNPSISFKVVNPDFALETDNE